MNEDILPNSFCWTRFGTEAGEAIGHILQRKENERAANDGVFIWGIGNAIGPSIRELLRRDAKPEVLFSPMKSTPKRQDVLPPAVAAWTSGETLDGDTYYLPEHSLVTSRYDPAIRKETHYALVCFSRGPLTPTRPGGKIAFAALRNLRTGRPIGASQVTAVVHALETDLEQSQMYEVAIRAELVYPYFIRLGQPLVLPSSADSESAKHDWMESVSQLIRRQREKRRLSQAATAFR